MKKRIVFVAIVFFVLLINLFSVSAAEDPIIQDLKRFYSGAKTVFINIAEALLGKAPDLESVGNVTASSLFVRVLFFMILFVVSWAVVKKIPIFMSSTWMIVIISSAISLLATRFLIQPEWIKTILLPYSVIGVSVTAIIPLFIYFFFLEGINSQTMRKIGWILAAVVFIGLWYSRREELKGAAVYVYPITALACLIFFTFDKTISEWMAKSKIEKSLAPHDYIAYNKVMNQIEQLREARDRFDVSSPDYAKLDKTIEQKEELARKILTRTRTR